MISPRLLFRTGLCVRAAFQPAANASEGFVNDVPGFAVQPHPLASAYFRAFRLTFEEVLATAGVYKWA